MVKLNKIYTRTGDDGTTGLVDGSRLLKSDPRVSAYGDVDETNSVIGVARCGLENLGLDNILACVQNNLFDLGADLATPIKLGKNEDRPDLRITADQVTWLEAQIDMLNADLTPLSSFVLPAGSPPSAFLHQARTVCRRAERSCIVLAQNTKLNPHTLTYLNRLSDFLFVAARWCNDQGKADVLWQPGNA